MSNVILSCQGSLYSPVGAASAEFTVMDANKIYGFSSTVACIIKQGTGSQTASAAASNIAVAAGQLVLLHSGNGINLAVIRQSADGHATLAPATIVR